MILFTQQLENEKKNMVVIKSYSHVYSVHIGPVCYGEMSLQDGMFVTHRFRDWTKRNFINKQSAAHWILEGIEVSE